MFLINSVHESIISHITFPLTNYLMNRGNIMGLFKSFAQTQWYSEQQLRALQLKKLKNVIHYAERYIPFYKESFKQCGFSSSDLKTLDNLKMIPVLSRQDVIENYKEMVDYRLKDSIKFADLSAADAGIPNPFARFYKHKLVKNTSSGSTGAPTVFYDNGLQSSINWAIELRLKDWFGIKAGSKEGRMARVYRDFLKNNKSLKIRKLLWNQILLPGIELDKNALAFAYQQLVDFQPKVVWGFTSALTSLADYLKERNLPINQFKPELIITWAAPLYDHEREKLISVFDCAVTNIYGTRELGHIAQTCTENSMHINQETVFVEEVPLENTDSVTEIVATTLHKSVMPFIRYKTGDIGDIENFNCKCGRKLQTITNLLGRTGEVFYSKKGKMISPNYWCRFFMNKNLSENINRFQVIYSKSKNVCLKIEKGNGSRRSIPRVYRFDFSV